MWQPKEVLHKQILQCIEKNTFTPSGGLVPDGVVNQEVVAEMWQFYFSSYVVT